MSNLEGYGLSTAILAGAIVIIIFLEPIGINGVTLSQKVYEQVEMVDLDNQL